MSDPGRGRDWCRRGREGAEGGGVTETEGSEAGGAARADGRPAGAPAGHPGGAGQEPGFGVGDCSAVGPPRLRENLRIFSSQRGICEREKFIPVVLRLVIFRVDCKLGSCLLFNFQLNKILFSQQTFHLLFSPEYNKDNYIFFHFWRI